MEGIAVRAEPEDVYNYVADFATLHEWCVAAGKLVPVEGPTESPLAIGSTFRMLPAEHSDEPYYAWTAKGEHTAQVADLVPGSRIEWRLDRGHPLYVVVEIERRSAGTHVTLGTHSGEPGWLRWTQTLLLLPVVPFHWLQSRSKESSWLDLIKMRVELGRQYGKAPEAKGAI